MHRDRAVDRELPASTPPAFIGLLRRCLERDPAKRLRDIGDVRLDDGDVSATSPVGSRPSADRRWWVLALAMSAALVVGVAIGRSVSGGVTAPPPAEVRFTFPADDPNFAAISPDGSMAVVASGGPLRVRDLVGVPLRELSGTDGAGKPFWSPDSRTIGFGRAGRLWRVSATGGAPTVICDLPGGTWDQDAGGAWLPDDTIVFTTGGSPLLRVAATGGDPAEHLTTTTPGEQHFHSVRAVPGARGLIYVVHRESGPDTLQVFAGGNRKVLLHAPGQVIRDPVYSPTGHILFGRTPVNEGVWAVPFSLDRMDATGAAYLVEAGLGTPSISTTGTFLSLPAPTAVPTRLQWFEPNGTARETIGEAAQFDAFPELSPDGTQIAIGERVSGAWGLSVIDVARHTRVRLAVGDRVSTPGWAPDGRSILYSATPDGTSEPVIKRAWLDGSPSTGDTVTLSRPRRLFARRAPLTEIGPDGFDVAKDGRLLMLERVASSTERSVHVVLNWTPRRAPGT